MTRDSNLRGNTRRDFIKGVLAASAAMGLGPTRALEMLDKIGGSALAADACVKSARVINIVAGTGSLSWFTLLWPVPSMIKNFKSTFPYDDPKKAVKVANLQEGRDLYVRQFDSTKPPLWDAYGAKKQVTALLAGHIPVSHEIAPAADGNTNVIPAGVGGAVQTYAAQAALQTSLQALVPVVGLKQGNKDMPYGMVPGAPAPATVPGAAEMAGLFNSAASRHVERLMSTRNQQLFQQYYTAVLGLAKTADRTTYQRAYSDSKTAVKLVGQNLGSQLMADPNKVQAWLGPAVGNEKLQKMAESLLVTANAFKLGLVSQVNFPVFNDDPHTAFGDVSSAAKFANGLGSVLQNFMDELSTITEPGCSTKLSDNVVLTISGDLPKNTYSNAPADWADSSPQGANWIYVMSNGWIKPGWFGDVPDANTRTLYDPITGKAGGNVPEATCTNAALAAVLYATALGDDRQVRNFFAGDYSGLINKSLTG